MITPIFRGKIENGKLILDSREGMEKYVAGLKGEVLVIIKKAKKIRSNKQNKYYWGVIIKTLGEFTGYEPEEMHNALKWKFLKIENNNLPSVRSTAKLSTLEFMTYIEQIIRFAAELGVVISDPESVDYENLDEYEADPR